MAKQILLKGTSRSTMSGGEGPQVFISVPPVGWPEYRGSASIFSKKLLSINILEYNLNDT